MNTTELAVPKKFYTAKHDRVFKAIFVNENDFHLMEALLSTCLGYNVKIIRYIPTELSVRNTDERVKRLDCLIEGDGVKYNIELNTSFDEATRVRNLNYFTSFYSQQTFRGKKYDAKTRFIHIDLSFGLSNNDPVKEIYDLRGKKTNKRYTDQLEFLVFNMDKIKKLWYDKSDDVDEFKYLLMLDLEKNELAKFGKKDKVVKEYEEKLNTLNESNVFIAPLSPEEDREYLENTRVSLAYDEGYDSGVEKGIVEQQVNTAKNMIKKDMKLEDICECTGLSIEKINEIKKEMS